MKERGKIRKYVLGIKAIKISGFLVNSDKRPILDEQAFLGSALHVRNLGFFRRRNFFFVILLSFLFLFCFYSVSISYSAPTYEIKFSSYESSGSSSNDGFMIIDSQTHYFPADVALEEGFHIIYYEPNGDYNFSRWEFIGIETASPGGEFENPTVISISGPGEVTAVYALGSQLDISRPSELKNAIFTDTSIRLRVRVMLNRKPVPDASVTFYVDSDSVGFNKTDGEGYASISFVPSEEKIYRWWAKAEKKNYASGSSDEWEFAFQRVRLDPPDDEILTGLPIKLVTFVELDGEPVEDARVSYFVDDEHMVSKLTQPNGYTSLKLDDITVGVHSWYVSVGISRWGIIFSEIQNFTYAPRISAELKEPKNNGVIACSVSTVKLRALVTYENKPLQGVNVSFFVKEICIGSNVSDINGFASFDFSPQKEDENYHWYVAVSEKSLQNGISPTWSFYYPVQPPYIEVDEIFTSKSRADINSEQTIGFHLRWENGSDVRGSTIRITDDHVGVTDDFGWITFSVSSSNVGEKVWKIIDVSCEGMGEFRHNDKYPKIIWDRILIELSVDKNRIDVGTIIVPEVNAFYEYDDTEFKGIVSYNNELYSNLVCEKMIGIKGIQDFKYNLSVFESNEISIIWDRVVLSLDIPNYRLEIGSEPNIRYEGIYEYDGKPFKGSVTFNVFPKQDYTGEKYFSVINIMDSLYNLSVFKSNKASYVFDDIEIKQEINTIFPTQIQILTTIHYKSDNKPVDDALVRVKGIGEYIGSGKYKSTIYTFSPFAQLSTEIILKGFKNRFLEQEVFTISNILSEFMLLFFILSVLINYKYHTYKGSKLMEKSINEFWIKLINSLKNEQLIRNWTVISSYLGRGDFTAIYTGDDYIECKSLNSKKTHKVPREDFHIMHHNWQRYIKRKIKRKDLNNKIQFIKYTISILHQYEKLM